MLIERVLPARFIRAPMREVLKTKTLTSHAPWPRVWLNPEHIAQLKIGLEGSIADRSPIGMREELWSVADHISKLAMKFNLIDKNFTRGCLWQVLPPESVASTEPHTDESLELPEQENGNEVVRATVAVSQDGASGGTIFFPGLYSFDHLSYLGDQIIRQAKLKTSVQLSEGEVGFFTDLDVHCAPIPSSYRGLLSLTFQPPIPQRYSR